MSVLPRFPPNMFPPNMFPPNTQILTWAGSESWFMVTVFLRMLS